MKLPGVRTAKRVRFSKLDFDREIGFDNCIDSFCKLGVVGCRIWLAVGIGLGGRHGCWRGLSYRESGAQRIFCGSWRNGPWHKQLESLEFKYTVMSGSCAT